MATKRKAAQAVKDSDGKVVRPAGMKPSAGSRADAAVKNDRKVTPAASSTKHKSHAATTKDANAPARQPAAQQDGRTSGKLAHKRTRATKGPLESSKKSEKPSPGEGGRLGGATTGMKPAELAKYADHFLIKDEPSDYAIEDLAAEKDQTAEWDGVRNYSARNVMRQMKKGDLVLFYRSGTKEPGVVGLCQVARGPYADHTAWNPASKYYDPKASPDDDSPRWSMVDVKLVQHFPCTVTLAEMKRHKEGALRGLALLHISRLSVMPLTKEHFDFICNQANSESG